mmetsp:Transcript_33458/g.104303  ORF Transcript_33458/g.104303 Transcript_33458/m.104303 type:complete len:298 (+) Transcript_33458:81-974(+)
MTWSPGCSPVGDVLSGLSTVSLDADKCQPIRTSSFSRTAFQRVQKPSGPSMSQSLLGSSNFTYSSTGLAMMSPRSLSSSKSSTVLKMTGSEEAIAKMPVSRAVLKKKDAASDNWPPFESTRCVRGSRTSQMIRASLLQCRYCWYSPLHSCLSVTTQARLAESFSAALSLAVPLPCQRSSASTNTAEAWARGSLASFRSEVVEPAWCTSWMFMNVVPASEASRRSSRSLMLFSQRWWTSVPLGVYWSSINRRSAMSVDQPMMTSGCCPVPRLVTLVLTTLESASSKESPPLTLHAFVP